jgi:DnaK suppressor protein
VTGEEQPSAVAVAAGGSRGPYWRAILETRWRARLQEVTELSVAYHDADQDGRDAGPAQRDAQRLLGRTVAARRGLADVEEALGRLAAGNFGYCEQCGSALSAALLAASPESGYCPCCVGLGSTGNGSARRLAE